jgi:hypothetical protein
MEPLLEDRFVVFLREYRRRNDRVEAVERELVGCPTYEEASRVQQAYHHSGRACIIRYVGCTGGGD